MCRALYLCIAVCWHNYICPSTHVSAFGIDDVRKDGGELMSLTINWLYEAIITPEETVVIQKTLQPSDFGEALCFFFSHN